MTISRDKLRKTYRYHFMYLGQRYTGRGYASKAAARTAEGLRRLEVESGLTPAFKNFSELTTSWLHEKKRTASKEWVSQLSWKLNKHCAAWATLPLPHITPGHVATLLQKIAEQGNGPRSVNEYRKILHAAFQYAVTMGALARNPVKPVARMGEPAEPLRPIPTADLEKLLLAAEPVLARQIILCALTGARWIEISRLRPEDLHLDQTPPYCELTTRKNKGGGERRRKQYLPPPAVEALRAQLADGANQWMFPSVLTHHGGHITPDGRQRHDGAVARLHRACDRAEIPHYGWHRIRYWCGSMAVTFGVSNKVIARFLGHATTAVTDRYMHLEDAALVSLSEQLSGQLRGVNRGANPVGETGPGGAADGEKASKYVRRGA